MKIVQVASFLVLLTVGITVKKKTLTKDDVDYTYYLGPDYANAKSSVSKGGRVSKRIAPHVSPLDI